MVSLLLGGCGVAGASEPGASAAGAPLGGDAATSAPAARSGIDVGNDVDPADTAAAVDEDQPGPTFPMTLRRTGGIADFADRVVVSSDGTVTVDTRAMTGRTCTLAVPCAHPAARRADRAAGHSPAPTDAATDVPSDGSTGVADGDAVRAGDAPDVAGSSDPGEDAPITLSVTDDLARTFDLTDTSLAGVTDLLGSVVTNVTLTLPAGARCTTPTDVPAPAPSVTAGLNAAG